MDKTVEELKAELEAERAKNVTLATDRDGLKAELDTTKTAVANFGEQAKAQRHTANVSFCEAQIKTGTLLPKDKASAIAVLDQLGDSQPVQFSEGNATHTVAPAEFIRNLIAGSKPKVQFGEHAAGRTDPQGLAVKGDSDADIDTKAKAYAATHKVNYAEALTAVTVTFAS